MSQFDVFIMFKFGKIHIGHKITCWTGLVQKIQKITRSC